MADNKIKIQSAGSVAGKETLYVDVDDEITTIIDKVQAAKGKVIALVLPKRSPVLQSIVNMKLLKRTADNADKNLVLITAEAGLLPLAGAVGLHVASTPTSKPSVPDAPAGPDDQPEEADEPLHIVDGNAPEDGEFDPRNAGGKTVGELSGAPAGRADDDIDESIDMDDDEPAIVGDADAASDAAAGKPPKLKKDKKLRVPNFDSFRKKVALGVLGVAVLVAAWIFAFNVLPKATITIDTDSSTITTSLNLTLDTTVKTLDTVNNVVPATAQSQEKTATQQTAATGQQNNGQKASGSVTFTAQKCSGSGNPPNVVTGTSLSSGGKTYITQESAHFTISGFSAPCANYTSNAVDIVALKGGAAYNLSGTADFSVTGRSDAAGSGTADGGTDDITTIVQQSDIDSATGKLAAADTTSIKQQLESNLESKGLQPVPVTFLAGTPQVTSSAQAGDAAANVTVTAVTTYTMLGVQKSDLQKLVDAGVTSRLDKGKQVILDDGVANASFSQANAGSATNAVVDMRTKSQAGPQLDVKQLKTQLAGRKSGDVRSFIKQTPGVTDVQVHFSPFWVSVVPKHANKVTITIEKAGK